MSAVGVELSKGTIPETVLTPQGTEKVVSGGRDWEKISKNLRTAGAVIGTVALVVLVAAAVFLLFPELIPVIALAALLGKVSLATAAVGMTTALALLYSTLCLPKKKIESTDADTTKTLEALQAEKAILMSQQAELEADLEKLKTEGAGAVLQAQLDEAQRNCAVSMDKVAELEEKILDLETKYNEIEDRNTDLEGQLKELQSNSISKEESIVRERYKELTQDIEKLESDLAIAESAVKEADGKIQAHKGMDLSDPNNALLVAASNEAYAKAVEQHEAIKQQLSDLTKQRDALANELDEYQVAREEVQSNVDELDQELVLAREELKAAKEELESTKQALLKKEAEVTTLEEKITALQEEVTASQKVIQEQTEALASSKEAISAKDQEIQTLKTQLQNVSDADTENQKQLQTLIEKVKDLQEQLQSTGEHEDLKPKVIGLEAQVKKHQMEIEELNEKLAVASKDTVDLNEADAKKAVEESAKQVDVLTAQVSALESEIKDLNEKIKARNFVLDAFDTKAFVTGDQRVAAGLPYSPPKKSTPPTPPKPPGSQSHQKKKTGGDTT